MIASVSGEWRMSGGVKVTCSEFPSFDCVSEYPVNPLYTTTCLILIYSFHISAAGSLRDAAGMK